VARGDADGAAVSLSLGRGAALSCQVEVAPASVTTFEDTPLRLFGLMVLDVDEEIPATTTTTSSSSITTAGEAPTLVNVTVNMGTLRFDRRGGGDGGDGVGGAWGVKGCPWKAVWNA